MVSAEWNEDALSRIGSHPASKLVIRSDLKCYHKCEWISLKHGFNCDEESDITPVWLAWGNQPTRSAAVIPHQKLITCILTCIINLQTLLYSLFILRSLHYLLGRIVIKS